MSLAITYSTTLVPETCFKCGIAFGMPRDFQQFCKRDKTTFYCPNGHGQVYARTIEQDLRRDLEDAQRRAASAEGSAKRERHRADGYKGAMRKAKKRVANGVCPCCTRTFRDLAAHMKTQHPEYAAEPTE